ncbi:MAG TPA: hypothetical protein VFK02_32015 [Kofleriaceae bacterium]|nr:hypothetical protein [Kofleriaceae bacterium]
MAQVRMLAWNIEVYGPNKYGNVPNNARVVQFIAQTAVQQNANVVVLMELSNSVAQQICFSVSDEIATLSGNAWSYAQIPARPNGDRESYGILWQSAGANFAITTNGAGAQNIALSTVDFPNNFSVTHGRRAALATFRTTDTAVNFTVSVYHAPPNAYATVGLEQVAKTPQLYNVDNGGAVQAVTGRLLGGDYNLDVNTVPEYSWLTNPVPVPPPPTAPGQGAGTVAITTALTHFGSMAAAVALWGNNLANWSANPVQYRDLQLDNIFWASPSGAPAPAGGVVDVVQSVMTPGNPLRAIAQTFTLVNPNTNNPAFPFAFSIPLPLNVNLSFAACAWMLVRYGVSDHLPVLNVVTI